MSTDFTLDRASLSTDSQNFMVKTISEIKKSKLLGNVFAIHCQSCKYRQIQDHPVELIGQKPIGRICGQTNSRGSICRRQLGNKIKKKYICKNKSSWLGSRLGTWFTRAVLFRLLGSIWSCRSVHRTRIIPPDSACEYITHLIKENGHYQPFKHENGPKSKSYHQVKMWFRRWNADEKAWHRFESPLFTFL